MNIKNPLLLFLKNFNTFTSNLNNQISKVLFNPIECYLMESNWENIFLKFFNNNSNKNYNLSSYPEINQYFIDNFILAVKYLQNGGQFSYISKDEMESFFNKEELNIHHNISDIYAENRKIIIDFKENNLNKSILIINPFENHDKRNIFIIIYKNNNKDKKKIFESLLLENINNLSDLEKLKEKHLEYLISFEDYIQIINSKEMNNNEIPFSLIKNCEEEIKEILQILIMLYYYEKYLSNSKNVFSEYKKYYLINKEWIEKYKEFYNYYDLLYLLKEYDSSNNYDINYLNINNYLESIINYIYAGYIKFKIQIGLPENLDIDSLTVSAHNSNSFEYYNNCYIIPSTIFEKIANLEFNKYALSSIKVHKILSRNECVIIHIDSKNINVGFLNEQYLFKIKYIFSYSSSNIYEEHKLYFSCLSFEKYIKQNYCNDRYLNVQIMKNEKGEKIGNLLVLNCNYNPNTSRNYNPNKSRDERKSYYTSYGLNKEH